MAKMTAIDSNQCRRAKPEGSPALICASSLRILISPAESPNGILWSSVLHEMPNFV
jgi:hypothetical protein